MTHTLACSIMFSQTARKEFCLASVEPGRQVLLILWSSNWLLLLALQLLKNKKILACLQLKKA